MAPSMHNVCVTVPTLLRNSDALARIQTFNRGAQPVERLFVSAR